MIKDDTLINVRNRNNGTTGYTLADGAKETRLWAENEVKKITFAELKRVSYLPGGAELLRDYLVIEDPAAIEALNVGIDIQEQPEYLYTENEIRNLLFNVSLDELKDFLDFSPDGGIEIAKQIAVNEELPDMRKRKIISEATGFNINTAIEINDMMKDNGVAEEAAPKKQRRVAKEAEATPEKPTRRTTTYKIVNQ